MRKDDYILQDSNRFNVSNGESRHVGVELDVEARSDTGFYAGLAAHLGEADLRLQPGHSRRRDHHRRQRHRHRAPHARQPAPRLVSDPWLAETEWVHQGGYYLTAQENQRYPAATTC